MDNQVAICRLEFTLGNKQYSFNALVNSYGVPYVFNEVSAPKLVEELAGKTILVKLDGVEFNACFVREESGANTVYSLKFDTMEDGQTQYLASLLEETGAKSPSRRRFPRLDVRQIEGVEVAIPTYIILRIRDKNYFLSILDFTLGGMLVECASTEKPNIKVGDRIEMEVFVTDGDHMQGIFAEVVRMTQAVPSRQSEEYTQYGLKLEKLSAANDQRYRKIIREYCLAIKADVGAALNDQEE